MSESATEGQMSKPESLVQKSAPERQVESSIGQAEQTIINRIDQGGDEDKVLEDIANIENSVDKSVFVSDEAIENYPEIKARSFTEAEALQKGFSRDFVLRFVNNILKNPNGSEGTFLKIYLDQVMPDSEEIDTAKSPERLSHLHTEVVEMIADNLKIGTVNLSDEQKQFIRFQRDQYVDSLKERSEAWKGLAEQVSIGKNPPEFASAAQLNGLKIKTNEGSVDISQFGGTKLPNVRSNIRIQDGVASQFVHWETDNVLRSKLTGEEVKMDRRIYLNPRTPELVEIFSKLMTALNEEGVSAQGKMLDRSYELAGQIRSKEAKSIRADAIVLAVKDSDADRVLAKVLDVYQKNSSVFVGRPTPKIPLKIAPGIAVGDEPEEVGASLTSHRERILEEAKSITRQRLGLKVSDKAAEDDRSVNTFNAAFSEVAVANGVNPNNLAFNAPN